MKSHLHEYKTLHHSTEAVVEVCRTCKNKLVTKFGLNKEYDFKTYYAEHRRDFLQPWMKEFHQEYGV